MKVGGKHVIRGSIHMPRVGVWWADLEVDSTTDITGAVTIEDTGFSLKGTAVNHGLFNGLVTLRVYGGNGGLGTQIDKKFYQNVPLRIPLSEILGLCGETLSPTSDTSVTGLNLRFWTREVSKGVRAIRRLLELQPCSYRILADGTFWVGTDTYPAAPKTKYDLLARDNAQGMLLLGSEAPFLMPGTLLGSDKISTLIHEVETNSFRTRAWLER